MSRRWVSIAGFVAVAVVGCSPAPPPQASSPPPTVNPSAVVGVDGSDAAVAAGEAVEAMQLLMFAGRDRADDLLEAIVVDGSPAEQGIRDEVNLARLALSPPERTDSGLWYVVAALTVSTPVIGDDGTAGVEVWAMHIASRDTVIDPTAEFRLHDLTLHQDDGRWKVWAWESHPGPVAQPVGYPATASELVAMLSDHRVWRS